MSLVPPQHPCIVDTWFLAAGRAPICIQPRRLHLRRGTSQHEFERQCLWIWGELVEAGRPVHIVEVQPTPQTIMGSVAHFLVIQDLTEDLVGLLVHSDAFPVLRKHRAILTTTPTSALEVFSALHYPHICQVVSSPCYLQDPLLEVMPYADAVQFRPSLGRLYHGGILPPDFGLAQEDSEQSDDADSEGESTDVPELEDDGPAVSPRSSDEGSDDIASLLHIDASCPDSGVTSSETLPWGEVPLEYKLVDLFTPTVEGPTEPSVPSWVAQVRPAGDLQEFSNPEDVFVLMQRERSRSRNQSHDHALDPELRASPGESSNSSVPVSSSVEADLINWDVIFTEMPFDPVNVQAGVQGPTASEAAVPAGLPVQEVVGVYPVTSLFQEQTENIVLLECRQDHIAHGSEALILFDVMCRDRTIEANEAGPHQFGPHLFHSAHISRAWLTFNAMTQVFHLARFIDAHPRSVVVRHNSLVWQPSDTVMRRFRNGDHLEIIFDDVADETYRADLITWLRAEGLNPWPSLQAEATGMVVSPTLPFSIADVPSQLCDSPGGGSGHTFRTWYISHRSHEVCRESRTVTFAGNPLYWKLLLSQVWNGLFDPRAAYTLTWVSPQPAADVMEGFDRTPHIIIEQHHREHRIAVHLTAVIGTAPDLQVTQGVFSVLDYCPATAYIDRMELDRLCARRYICRVTHDSVPIREDEIIHRPTGQAITIRAFERASSSTDAASLMQMPADSTHAGAPDTGGSTCSPDLPDPVVPAAAAELSALPIAGSPACDMPPRGQIATYFLSAINMPRCAFPRFVNYQDALQNWHTVLTRLWHELIDQTSPVEIFVVQPVPVSNYALEDGPTIYALVVQHRAVHNCPALVTLAEPDQALHIAVFITPSVTVRQVITSVGQGRRCFNRMQNTRCRLFIGQQLLLPTVEHGITPGTGLHLEIAPISVEENVPESIALEARGLQLLQRSARRVSSAHLALAVPTLPILDESCPTWWTKKVRSYTEDNSDLRSGSATPSTPDPKVLDLHGALALRETLVDFQGVFNLHQRLSDLCLPVVVGWPAGFLLSDLDLQAAFHLPIWTCEDPLELTFYTDASYVGTAAVGVGIVLVVQTTVGPRLGGTLSLAHYGTSSFPGEQLALGWALLWAHQLQLHRDLCPNAGPLSIQFCFDAQAVGFMAAGWMQPRQDEELASFLRALGHCLEEFWGASWITWSHVKGHSGHLWNEVADRLANFGREGTTIADPAWLEVVRSSEAAHLAWLWAVKPLKCGDPTLPPLCGHHVVHGSHLPHLPQAISLSAWTQQDTPASCSELVTGQVLVATANVLSLSERKDAGMSIVGARQLAIMEQFHIQGVHFVGVQETRHKNSVSQNNQCFHVLGHPATAEGLDGVQLWISKTAPLTQNGKRIEDDHFAVIAQATFVGRSQPGQLKKRRPQSLGGFQQLFASYEGAQAVRDALPVATWGQSVHQDAADFSRACEQLHSWIPVPFRKAPRKRHLQASTWNLIQCKKALYLRSD
eukprot:Skav200178  [mRNA]  locus=scaffold1159:319485:324559:- [translate_table: standard]